jgi:hypothetical protein
MSESSRGRKDQAECQGLEGTRLSPCAACKPCESLQVGVDARLEEVELEIEGVRAKLLLKVDLDNVRAILRHALDTVAEHPEILRILTRALDDLLTGRLGIPWHAGECPWEPGGRRHGR